MCTCKDYYKHSTKRRHDKLMKLKAKCPRSEKEGGAALK